MATYRHHNKTLKLKIMNPLSISYQILITFTFPINPNPLIKLLSNKENFILKNSDNQGEVYNDRVYIINMKSSKFTDSESISKVFVDLFMALANYNVIVCTFPKSENYHDWAIGLRDGIEVIMRREAACELTVCVDANELDCMKNIMRQSSYNSETNVNDLSRLRAHIFTKFLCGYCKEFAYKPSISRCCSSIYCHLCAVKAFCSICNIPTTFDNNQMITKIINESPYRCNCGIEVMAKDKDSHLANCISSTFKCNLCPYEGSQVEVMDHVFEQHQDIIVEKMDEITAMDMLRNDLSIMCPYCGSYGINQCCNCESYLPGRKPRH